jgi:Fatty acid hydroxylase superfamily
MRDSSPERLGPWARDFFHRPSPKLIAAAIAIVAAARIGIGDWSWRDGALPAALIVLYPLTEWLIHVYLLHSKPLRIAGRKFDLPTTREHRAHHREPAFLDGVLLPLYGVLLFLPMIAGYAWVVSLVFHAIAGGDQLAYGATTLLTSYTILGVYEWSHFLIHTTYRPRGRYYRAIWRTHRLHHYKNERYWFGVTTTVGDRVLGTAPDQSLVSRSQTARTLGTEH